MSAIGALRHRVELVGVGRVDDGAGGFTRADVVAGVVWAAIRPASMREIEAAGRLEMRISHVFTIRFRADLLPSQGGRVRWQDAAGRQREGYIEAASDPDERGRFLELMIREGGAL
jgi:SPP1 family predicted phage head-tail adaptor